MQVVETINEMRALRKKMEGTVGFVPTMGYLHEGHLTLVRRSREANENTVVSIFVNPTQFGPAEDFKKYPRDTEYDLARLEKEEVDVVFMPSVEAMYPRWYSTYIQVREVTNRLEGASRPGHFEGVATVVAKLFNIVQANQSYFGQKDAQQVVVIKRMAEDLNFGTEIIVVPTVREEDGLAMSSRNVYLNIEERRAALVLYRSLLLAQQNWLNGVNDTGSIRGEMRKLIESEPQAKIDYISIASPDTLEELNEAFQGALVSLAVHIGKTRLIDNIQLGLSKI